eukprot:COSAG02_NODE_4798_length_4965_cov_8.333950_2_plen_54_part_00
MGFDAQLGTMTFTATAVVSPSEMSALVTVRRVTAPFHTLRCPHPLANTEKRTS